MVHQKKRFSLIHISRPLCAILIWWLVWLLLLLRRGVTRRSTVFPQIVHETATWWWEICCSVVGIMHVFLWPLFLFSPFQVSAMNCKFFLLSDLNLCTKKQIYLWRSMFNFFMHINIIVIRSIFFKNQWAWLIWSPSKFKSWVGTCLKIRGSNAHWASQICLSRFLFTFITSIKSWI